MSQEIVRPRAGSWIREDHVAARNPEISNSPRYTFHAQWPDPEQVDRGKDIER
jgi:hypothetical protein